MELVWVMITFFIFITILFIVMAIAFPEWFGITGKRALEIRKNQEEKDDKGSDKSSKKS